MKVYGVYEGKYEPELIKLYYTRTYAQNQANKLVNDHIRWLRRIYPEKYKNVSNKELKKQYKDNYFVIEDEVG